MGKRTEDVVLDGALNIIKTTGTKLHVCSTEPTTYAQANASYNLATVAITSANYTGPADDTSGRKLTVNAQSSISVTSGSSAQHIAITTASALLNVTTCSTQSLTSTQRFPPRSRSAHSTQTRCSFRGTVP